MRPALTPSAFPARRRNAPPALQHKRRAIRAILVLPLVVESPLPAIRPRQLLIVESEQLDSRSLNIFQEPF